VSDTNRSILAVHSEEMYEILSELLAWSEYMGHWEAPPWNEARRLVATMQEEFELGGT